LKGGVWAIYHPTESSPWNLRRVVHLHRRAGFAATWREIQRDLRDGPEKAVDRLLAGTSRIDGIPTQFEELSARIGDAAVIANDADRLKAWWLFRMLFSPDVLGERITLMWHNHFATSNFKVRDLGSMRGQNQSFRTHGRARFGRLLEEMLHDPALLVWLDASSNRKGQPNENLARELMELFTLGVGNFTEQDVKEAARALTGWSVTDSAFRERPQWHDDGEKQILGQRGTFDGVDLQRILLQHPATAKRLAWRLRSTFMGENVVDDAAMSQLADSLREHDLDIGWAVETILRSNLFFSDANIGSRVCGPVEFSVGACHALELFEPPPSTLLLAEWIRRLGLDLFYPPNVGGWNEGRAWLTTRTVLARANFAAALVRGELNLSNVAPDLQALAQQAGRAGSLEESLAFFNDLLLGGRAGKDTVNRILQQAKSSAESDALAKAVALLLCEPEASLS
jgi:uncharacterized protein (DUF1800 family)